MPIKGVGRGRAPQNCASKANGDNARSLFGAFALLSYAASNPSHFIPPRSRRKRKEKSCLYVS